MKQAFRCVICAFSCAFILSSSALVQAEDRVVVAGQDGVPAPKRSKTINPVYPQEALAQGVRGIVILEILIDRQGKVASADVIRSIPLLDEAALTAVRKWEYEPLKVDGQPVSVKLTVPITFALKLPEVTRAPGIPELRQGSNVSFPAGATEGSTVTAQITLGTDGQVAEADVIKGSAPYTVALLQALRTWRFAPESENVILTMQVDATFTAPGRSDKGHVDVRLGSLRRSESMAGPANATADAAAPATAGALPATPAALDPGPATPSPTAEPGPAPAPPVTAPAPVAPSGSPSTPEPSTPEAATPSVASPVPPPASSPTAPPSAPSPVSAPHEPTAPTPLVPAAPSAPAGTGSPVAPAAPAPTTAAPSAPTGQPTPAPAGPGTPATSTGPATASAGPSSTRPSTAAPPVEVITAPPPPGAESNVAPMVQGVSAVKDVTLAMGVPDLVRGHRPVPPPLARMSGTTGSVEVRFGVDAAGATSVQETRGDDPLKTAAVYTVQSWLFRRVTVERLHLLASFDYAGETAKVSIKPE